MWQLRLKQSWRLAQRIAQQTGRCRSLAMILGDLRAEQGGAGERRDFARRLTQQLSGKAGITALPGGGGEFAEIVCGNHPWRSCLDPRQQSIHVQGLLPFVLQFVDPAQRIEGDGAQPRHLADLLKQAFGAVQHAGAQIVLGEGEQRLFTMLGRQRSTRQHILMDTDGPLDLAAPAVQRAQGKVSFEGVAVGIHESQEHVQRPVGLLGHEIIETGEIVGMQLVGRRAEQAEPAFTPPKVADENTQNEGGNPGGPGEQRQVGHDEKNARRPSTRDGRTGASIADWLVRTVVDALAKILARLEMRNMLAGKRDGLAGLRITPLAGWTKMQRETAESADLDTLSGCQRITHDLQQLLHREFDIFRRQVFLFGRNDLDEFGFRHYRSVGINSHT